MLYTLLINVWNELKEDGIQASDPSLGDKLANAVQVHVEGLTADIAKKKTELETELSEKKKKITSDDIMMDSPTRSVLYAVFPSGYSLI